MSRLLEHTVTGPVLHQDARGLGVPAANPFRSLSGRTVVVSGGSEALGLAIAVRAARDGANLALFSGSAAASVTASDAIQAAAQQICSAGGQALVIAGDGRDEAGIEQGIATAVDAFGGIDICINFGSAIDLSPTRKLSVRQYDRMQSLNTRRTFLFSRECVPHLARSANPHILTISPPLNLNPRWAGEFLGYTIAQYGMSLCTLGLSEELRPEGIAANSLWPKTFIATAALRGLLGSTEATIRARAPQIMADAAHAVLTRPARDCTGNLFIDEDVLRQEGVTDFRCYQVGSDTPALDLFIDPDESLDRDHGAQTQALPTTSVRSSLQLS